MMNYHGNKLRIVQTLVFLLFISVIFATHVVGRLSDKSEGNSEWVSEDDDDVIMDGYYGDNSAYQRQIARSPPDYLNVSDTEIYAALLDKDIDVYRDNLECTYAFEVFRAHVHKPIMIFKRGLASKAERWAVYLASRWRQHKGSKFAFFDEERELGQLIYFADNMDQGPGCEMAISGWANKIVNGLVATDNLFMNKAIDMAGNLQQIFWTNASKYGIGISYSRMTKSGFLVAFFKERLPENEQLDTSFKYEKKLKVWQMQLPGFRNPLQHHVNAQTNLGYMPCISSNLGCKSYAEKGHCQIPAFQSIMNHTCFRYCYDCIENIPIDGGWSAWSQVSGCDDDRCGENVYYRFCNNPPVIFGGKDCSGERVRRRNC
ncbi:uncharacterized protein [Clytia hemisphaerica]